jgi:L-2-hydroxyglutarate oxidase LhgO
MNHIFKTDIILFGGGIAGLWLLNRLKKEGYSVILLENEKIGGTQTIHSQGVIHSGFKYQNHPEIVAKLKEMQREWTEALQGRGGVDLSKTKVSAQHQHYWTQNVAVNADFYDKLVGNDFKKLSKKDFPSLLQHSNYTGKVFEAAEMILDMPSLIQNLYDNYANFIFKINQKTDFCFDEKGVLKSLTLQNGDSIEAQFFIFTAGAGNESLVNELKIKQLCYKSMQKMQKRPLHQVVIYKQDLPDFNGVCVSPELNAFTPVIITTHYTENKQKIWNLGGDIATKGVERSEKEQILFAKSEMNRLLPNINWSNARWATYRVDRAEPLQSEVILPTDVCVDVCMNAIQIFPVKFALMPDVAHKVLTIFNQLKMNAIHDFKIPNLNKPDLMKPVWGKHIGT